ncbi:MAG: hypothetical protein AAFQ83_11750 [Bacteroidota bacterium]
MKLRVHLFSLFLTVAFLSSLTGRAQSFDIPAPTTWRCDSGAYELKGTYANVEIDHVWLCLKDRFGNVYVQYPAVSQASLSEWEHFNVRVLGKENLIRIMAISVDKKGNQVLQKWEEENRVRGVKLSKLKEVLSGFLILASKSLDELEGDC